VRLQKYLSRAGVASRRRAEELIAAGRVRVNGTVVREMGVTVEAGRDGVEVDGVAVDLPASRWLLLHKPPGVLTTRRDPGGGRTVYDLLPRDSDALRYVGRLDRDTEGLLLMTTDGDLLHRLTHPSFEVEREYWVEVKGEVDPATLRRLEDGVVLEDGPARARRAWIPRGVPRNQLRLILTEGRKREVRRLMEAVDRPVRRLRRERYGPVRLGDLEPGTWRKLTEDEITELRRAVE
jgi:23S rRNA pseudouridine2605 synthase